MEKQTQKHRKAREKAQQAETSKIEREKRTKEIQRERWPRPAPANHKAPTQRKVAETHFPPPGRHEEKPPTDYIPWATKNATPSV